MFSAYFVIALVIGHLATKLREREQSERRREERATAIYRFTRALAASRDLDEALPKVLALIKESFQADAAVWLRDEDGLSCHRASTSCHRAKTKALPSGRFKKNKPLENRQTRCLTRNRCMFRWLRAIAPKVCSLCAWQIRQRWSNANCSTRLRRSLHFSSTKRARWKKAVTAQVARQSERLQKALFDSVSHELKTPLAAMSVALQQPQPNRAELQQAARR